MTMFFHGHPVEVDLPAQPPPKKMPITNGIAVVFGVPAEIKPIRDCPPGRMRMRFRNTSAGKAYFKTPEGIRCFIICRDPLADGGGWFINPKMEQGRNHRP